MLIILLQRASLWSSTLMLPVYLACISLVIALLHVIVLATPLKKILLPHSASSRTVLHSEPNPDTGFLGSIKVNIKSNGGLTIWLYKVLRLLGCLALLGVSIAAAVLASDDTLHTNGKHWGKHGRRRHRHKHKFSAYEYIQIALCAFYVRTPSSEASPIHLFTIWPLGVYEHSCTLHTRTSETPQETCKESSRDTSTYYMGCIYLSRLVAIGDLYTPPN
jgi:hypothetical protein